MHRQARSPGLAEGLRVQLACSRGSRYLALEARHRGRATLPDGRASGERGGDRGQRAQPNAGAGTPGVRPHRVTPAWGGVQCAHTADPCNKVTLRRKPHFSPPRVVSVTSKWLAPTLAKQFSIAFAALWYSSPVLPSVMRPARVSFLEWLRAPWRAPLTLCCLCS